MSFQTISKLINFHSNLAGSFPGRFRRAKSCDRMPFRPDPSDRGKAVKRIINKASA